MSVHRTPWLRRRTFSEWDDGPWYTDSKGEQWFCAEALDERFVFPKRARVRLVVSTDKIDGAERTISYLNFVSEELADFAKAAGIMIDDPIWWWIEYEASR